MLRNAKKVYIIMTKWDKYPNIWINKYVYRRKDFALKKIKELVDSGTTNLQLVERWMF